MAMTTPIEVEELLERVDGNVEFAKQMLKRFFSNHEERTGEIEKCITEENFPELRNSAHRLKGIVGNLSLVKSFGLLFELEQMAVTEDMDGCIKKINEAKRSIVEAKDYYEANPDIFSG